MNTPPLKLLSSMATRELLQALLAQYQRMHAVHVIAEADGGVNVLARVRSGEFMDIVVLAQGSIDDLIAEGRLIRETAAEVVRSGVAVAVPAGASHPDISSAQALRQAILAAPSIGYSTGPSGKHLERLFAQWGILDTLRERITIAPAGVPVASLLCNGSIQLGFQQLSEMLGSKGVSVVGPLPREVQSMTTFTGAVSVTSRHPDAAAAVLEFLALPAHAETRVRLGMEA
jgi:molybdate transport system substrate-binding protein